MEIANSNKNKIKDGIETEVKTANDKNSMMMDLVMQVMYEIKTKMEVSTKNEPFDASKMVFATIASNKT